MLWHKDTSFYFFRQRNACHVLVMYSLRPQSKFLWWRPLITVFMSLFADTPSHLRVTKSCLPIKDPLHFFFFVLELDTLMAWIPKMQCSRRKCYVAWRTDGPPNNTPRGNLMFAGLSLQDTDKRKKGIWLASSPRVHLELYLCSRGSLSNKNALSSRPRHC